VRLGECAVLMALENLLKISDMQASVHVDPVSFEPGHPKSPRAGGK
jgi:hypothetical protein